ncbi:putative serine protein kinase [Aaosphaeria arxii CBS 175.79]|uniref:non-specific serine/threonine protein kinase n=1 Tax=Aaosphaeria arxii CBS 175.79 TaxID=1450172 RepID=A0A6A5XHL7_9PLEO|nr:putative serine protein kinase [Aaosphaeria arxii CBS 175.79]KAF2012463.1 putative serine protein kinase [Aaosphaeria arxii CBS 175.79]
MTSPPPTPPAEVPSDEQFFRFKETGAPCEGIEEYRPGGFHPVNLGDTFHDGKYKVIRKLGAGSFSTVWLAVSTGTPRYVALKIMIAKAPGTNTELCILDHLSKQAPGDIRAQHVTAPLDIFQHQGINGKHQCLVFELMGGTAASVVEELPENKPKKYGKRQRYPKWMAKRILLHGLRGLAFLHQNGVVHGDVQPGNLLFSIADISPTEEESLKQDEASTAVPVHRVDGKADRWAPKNLYLKQPLYDRVQVGPETCVKLSDLGSAFWLAERPSKTVTPIGLRAPELILHQSFGLGIDIWSFGCLIFEFLTGRALFAIGVFGCSQKAQEDADDEHLIQLNDVIRPLPDSMMTVWPRASKWYTPDHQRLQPHSDEELDSDEESYSDVEPYIYPSLEELFAEEKSPEIDDEESAVVCSLMQQIFEYDPAKRPSAEDLLKHPWFSE